MLKPRRRRTRVQPVYLLSSETRAPMVPNSKSWFESWIKEHVNANADASAWSQLIPLYLSFFFFFSQVHLFQSAPKSPVDSSTLSLLVPSQRRREKKVQEWNLSNQSAPGPNSSSASKQAQFGDPRSDSGGSHLERDSSKIHRVPCRKEGRSK